MLSNYIYKSAFKALHLKCYQQCNTQLYLFLPRRKFVITSHLHSFPFFLLRSNKFVNNIPLKLFFFKDFVAVSFIHIQMTNFNLTFFFNIYKEWLRYYAQLQRASSSSMHSLLSQKQPLCMHIFKSISHFGNPNPSVHCKSK